MLPLLCAFPNNPFHRTSPHCQSLPRHIHNCVPQNCSRFRRLKSVTPVSFTLPSISLTQLPSLYLLFILTRSTNLKTLSAFSQLAFPSHVLPYLAHCSKNKKNFFKCSPLFLGNPIHSYWMRQYQIFCLQPRYPS